MHALPAAPAPTARRQLFVGTSLACAAGAMLYGGMVALFLRFRHEALVIPGGEWKPAVSKVPEVATNTMLVSFLAALIFAQWAVYAARRGYRSHTAMALALVALVGIAIINAQAFVYHQMRLGIASGTYEMFFYTLTGTFVALMIVGIVFTLVASFRFLGGRVNDREIVTAHAMYWYFLSTVYIALWFVVYVTK
jgi:cytochrome c oxidase subunit 3